MKQLSEVLDWIPALAGMTKVKQVPVRKTLFSPWSTGAYQNSGSIKEEGTKLAARMQANFEELGI
jgi:hypothetical protein